MTGSVGGVEFGGALGVTPFGFTAQLLSNITEVMFPEFPQDVCADVGVVMGTGIMSIPVLAKGVELLKKGQIDHLILTGGAVVNDLPETAQFAPMIKAAGLPLPQDGEKEADYMACFLGIVGIPSSKYSIENTSTNTGGNLRGALEMGIMDEIDSVNLIGILPTRALMTFRQAEKDLKDELSVLAAVDLPPKIVTLTNIIPLPGVTAENWFSHPVASGFVLAEFAKIDPAEPNNYLRKGFCQDVSLKDEIALAQTLRRWPQAKAQSVAMPPQPTA